MKVDRSNLYVLIYDEFPVIFVSRIGIIKNEFFLNSDTNKLINHKFLLTYP